MKPRNVVDRNRIVNQIVADCAKKLYEQCVEMRQDGGVMEEGFKEGKRETRPEQRCWRRAVEL